MKVTRHLSHPCLRTPGAWSPLVTGETAAAALAAAEAIASDLASDPAPAAALGLGLSRGQAGLALFFACLERSLGHAAAGERARHHLDVAIAQLAEQAAADPSLYHGFAGVAWVAEHLAAGEASAEDEDPNAEIDAALLSVLRRGPWRGEFDLMGGLVGWGVYALERLPRPSAAAMLQLVVSRLAECAERAAQGIVWRDPRNVRREPDPGMAHGAAGAIALLARIVLEGAASPEAVSLLAAAVGAVLHRPRHGDDEEDDLAWCAGDAGLSVALLAASHACGREDWEQAALRTAAAAADRYPEDVGGFDPALCHGTAGLSHLFHRLYQATGDPALLAAARRWLERTLARRRPGSGIGGYLCRGRQADGHFAWLADPGFLGGAAGIGLALLAAAAPVEPAWDRLLLLSGRTNS
ncbi:MAG TPA: lanthionine synthetase LanC family protein [Thermoanaerobaculia bacterium]|nr:lanthionine synthetase LanC family protein [Thermoanaerobaculia bacterium]